MDETVSQIILFSNKEEGNHKDEDEATVSQIGDEIVLGLRNTKVTNRNDQRVEGQLLKIVKIETEKIFADTEIQHTEEVLEENQVINGWLKCLLKEFEQVSQVVKETREDTSL